MIDKTISGYTIKSKIGEGGMAEVYYAENNLGKKAAVKILKPRLCEDINVVTRFENEAKVMVKLEHPNITQVLDYGTINGRPCIVMAYLEGDDLKNRLKKGERFSDKQLQKWWNQLVDALNHTHQQSIVHRDIKPSNIFIDKSGNVKLMDFGIAKIKDAISITSSGTQIGTLLYMSPEQVLDSKHIDYRTDLYSLAITFVHLLTRKAPYDTTTTNDYMIRKGIVEKPVDLSKLPANWRVFLEPYLAKEPKYRPPLRHWEEPVIIIDDPPAGDPDDGTLVDVGKGNGNGNGKGNVSGKGNDDGKGGGKNGKGAGNGKGNGNGYGKDGGGEKESKRKPLTIRKTILYASVGFFGALLLLLLIGFAASKKHNPTEPEPEVVLPCCDNEQAESILASDSIKQSDWWNIDRYARIIPKLNEGYALIADCYACSGDDEEEVRKSLVKAYKNNVYQACYIEETGGGTTTEGKRKTEERMSTLKTFTGFDESEYQQYKSSKK